jgi:hypothetical protein
MSDEGKKFKLKRETITKLTPEELKSANGGSSWICVASGVASGYSIQKLDQWLFPNGFGGGLSPQKMPGSRVFKTPGGCAD